MSERNEALMNLVLLAHAEIRALRDVIGLMIPALGAAAPVNLGNWAEVEAQCRRNHLEALGLSMEQFDLLVGTAMQRLEREASENCNSLDSSLPRPGTTP